MSTMSVTDVPEEILATKAGGGGASPLPRLRAFLGSHLLGVQARSGLPECEVSQTAHGGATQVDVPSDCGTDFPRNAPRSGRACSEIPGEVRLPVTDTLQDGDIGKARDVTMDDLSGSTDQGMRNCDAASGFKSAGPYLIDLGVPRERSAPSVSGLDANKSDVSNSTDRQYVSHTSITTTKPDHFNSDQFSRLTEQAVPAGPDHVSDQTLLV